MNFQIPWVRDASYFSHDKDPSLVLMNLIQDLFSEETCIIILKEQVIAATCKVVLLDKWLFGFHSFQMIRNSAWKLEFIEIGVPSN